MLCGCLLYTSLDRLEKTQSRLEEQLHALEQRKAQELAAEVEAFDPVVPEDPDILQEDVYKRQMYVLPQPAQHVDIVAPRSRIVDAVAVAQADAERRPVI